MGKVLLDKMRKAREKRVEVDGHAFTILRPTDADAVAMAGRPPLEFVERFVVGWDMTELDLVPGGMAEPVAFDADVWIAWVRDHPEVWDALGMAILDAYESHVKAREAAAKN